MKLGVGHSRSLCIVSLLAPEGDREGENHPVLRSPHGVSLAPMVLGRLLPTWGHLALAGDSFGCQKLGVDGATGIWLVGTKNVD